ncbi:hypothetical protein [Corynebacterium doosanense]|uniref:Membrane protein n=1 Tax=Corynebacterium doosanense CAU 212 = DSM 45436 TaxID=558173 RepID=A0A097IIA6_9CORY|nr:hypothetical protein [Corynebacterium doosanense]AIT61864.1 membrane protein [Corynebacterium doosanense CAU 212 = DSM 45436]
MSTPVSEAPAASGRESREGNDWLKIAGIVLLLPCVIALMLFAFLAPNFASGPHELPVAISAPDPVVTQLSDATNAANPDAFSFDPVGSDDEVRGAVEKRDAIGGLTMDPATGTATIYTAAGNGAPYPAVMQQLAGGMQALGLNVQMVEVAPYSQDDPQGSGLNALGLPLAFGGMISAALMTTLFKGKPWHKLVGALGIAALGGLVVAAILHHGYGVLTGDFWLEALALACGIAATSLVVTGLGSLLGMAGVGLGAVLTIFISNPLSGLATGWWWLPQPWGMIGQYMPIGAAGYLLRSISYFDNHHGGHSWTVLGVWMLVGALLIAVGGVRNRRAAA